MSNIFAVASSKGGVGKSTICNHLARTMAKAGQSTILIETDSGLRGLDILLDMPNVIYDIFDVIKGNCSLSDAVQTNDSQNGNLALLPAPFSFKSKLDSKDIEQICKQLENKYKNIIIDLNCGFELTLEIAKLIDMLLVVTTPDPVCVRDVAIFVNYLKKEASEKTKIRLIINKMQKKLVRKNILKNLDEIIDETAVQLIGVIPQSNKLEIANFCGQNLKKNCLPHKIFKAIFDRINENYKKLLI